MLCLALWALRPWDWHSGWPALELSGIEVRLLSWRASKPAPGSAAQRVSSRVSSDGASGK